MQGTITDILEENVVQPLLVSSSAIRLATETVRSIMKIDDIVSGGGEIWKVLEKRGIVHNSSPACSF